MDTENTEIEEILKKPGSEWGKSEAVEIAKAIKKRGRASLKLLREQVKDGG